MVVELGDQQPAAVEEGAEHGAPGFTGQRGAVQDENARRVVVRSLGIDRRGEHGRDRGIGGHRPQRMHDPHMRYAADRLQHIGRDRHALLRAFAHAPDILQRRGAPGVVVRVDAECSQRGRDHFGELGGLVAVKHPRGDVARHEAVLHQPLAHAAQAEPAQVRLVQQADRLVVPGAAQQLLGEAPVFQVGNADQDDAVRRQRFGLAFQHRPGIAQMLEDVAVDDAVDALGHVERHRVVLDIDGGKLVEPFGGDGGEGWVLVDAEQSRAGVAAAIGGAECRGAAADVQHHAGGERDPLQKVGVGQVGGIRHGQGMLYQEDGRRAPRSLRQTRRRALGGRRNPGAGASAIG